jgi:hypothetical protein
MANRDEEKRSSQQIPLAKPEQVHEMLLKMHIEGDEYVVA